MHALKFAQLAPLCYTRTDAPIGRAASAGDAATPVIRVALGRMTRGRTKEGTMATRMRLSAADEAERDRLQKLEMSTAEIGLTVRTTNCLEEKGIFTVRDLLQSKREDLLSISNFGEKTLEEVYVALEKIGFYRPGHEAPKRAPRPR